MNTQLNLSMALLPSFFAIAGGLALLPARQAAAFSNDMSSHLAAGTSTIGFSSASVTSSARTGTSGSSTSQGGIASATNTSETDGGTAANTSQGSTSAGSIAGATNATEADSSAVANASQGSTSAGGTASGTSATGTDSSAVANTSRAGSGIVARTVRTGGAAATGTPEGGAREGRPPTGVWWGRPRRAARPQGQAAAHGGEPPADGGGGPYPQHWLSLGREMGTMLLQDDGPGPGYRLGTFKAWLIGAAVLLVLVLVPAVLCCAWPRAEGHGEHPQGKPRQSCIGRRSNPNSAPGSASSLAASNLAIDDTRPASSRAGSLRPDAKAEPVAKAPTGKVYTFG